MTRIETEAPAPDEEIVEDDHDLAGGDSDGSGTGIGAGRLWPTPIRTQRTLQIVLGLLWILDAALQYQPFMFGRQFVPTYITANAAGQLEPVAWLITTAGHFISPNVGVWNALFATVQVFIGFGLLFRPTVRPALVTSFFWAFGVWFFGEGMGMVLTGTASALSGAPGSVFLYGLVGLMAWPRRVRPTGEHEDDAAVGIASSGAAQGIGGLITPLAVWAGYWLLAAALFLMPANRITTSVSGSITGMASGEPPWYASFLNHVGSWSGSAGITQTWLLAVLALVVGVGPLLFRRVEVFLALGFVTTILFWITGQGLGGILTGSGTDPNTGPMVAVLALAMVPTIVPRSTTWQSPVLVLFRRHPSLTAAGGIGGLCVLLLAATYPAAASPSGGSGSMSNMSGMSGSSMSGSSMSGSSDMSGMTPSTQTARTTNCTSDVVHHGLDLTNSPIMAMGAKAGATMNMNGADASAAAGLNATTANWTYTGPALPSGLANELLTDGANGPDDVHMASSGCAKDPTFGEEVGAFSYVQGTSNAASKYPTPASAVAGGYQLASPAGYPITYYVNPVILAANASAKRTLDPGSVDGLVYAEPPSGQEVLAAAFYVLPSSVSAPPAPYGALVQWHQRTDVCTSAASNGSNTLNFSGFAPCAAGTVRRATPYLTMVWQLPVAGGPLAIQPPDIQIVEAAVMATTGS
jgi:hypothetical protein